MAPTRAASPTGEPRGAEGANLAAEAQTNTDNVANLKGYPRDDTRVELPTRLAGTFRNFAGTSASRLLNTDTSTAADGTCC